MIKKCLVCKKEFKTYPSKIKLGRGKYCSKECCLIKTNKILEENGRKTRFVKGQKAHNYNGGYIKKGKNTSYLYINKPEHPNCNKDGCVPKHRLIMENIVGRLLDKCEEIHHIDYNGLNNNIDNLRLLSSSEHKRLHLKDNVHKRWISPAK